MKRGVLMRLTKDMKIDEIKKIPELVQVSDYFTGRRDGNEKDEEGCTFQYLNDKYNTWNPQCMIYGVEALIRNGKNGKNCVYSVYSQDEIAADPTRKDVKLIAFPGEKEKPFVILCAGGAYHAVCSIVEAFPVAAKFSSMGYPVFCLNYRTWKSWDEQVLPMALEDLAAAVKFISSRKDELGLGQDDYAVGGFSAGGNLTAEFGIAENGYKKYGLKKPDVLFCIYAVLNLKDILEKNETYLIETMFGRGADRETVEKYDVITRLDKEYPPCYLVAAEDDDMVDPENSRKMYSELSKKNIPAKLEIGKSGGHGFGLGDGTSLEGWVERGIGFWEQLQQQKGKERI